MTQGSDTPRYIRNPDVVLREEDEDGGLLFNPDTNQIRVLNHTGLFVWEMCDGSHTLSEILAALRESFESVPDEQVEEEVKTFMVDMEANGFLGVESSERMGTA